MISGQIDEDKRDPKIEQRESLLEKSQNGNGPDIKKVEVRVLKSTEQILLLQHQVKE